MEFRNLASGNSRHSIQNFLRNSNEKSNRNHLGNLGYVCQRTNVNTHLHTEWAHRDLHHKLLRSTMHNKLLLMASFSELELEIIRWSEARKIIPNSTPFAQSIKAVEEINELVDALRDNNKAEAIDAVGDTVVCLINVCALLDVNLTDCLAAAYDQIKDRKGYMNAEGIFVKQV